MKKFYFMQYLLNRIDPKKVPKKWNIDKEVKEHKERKSNRIQGGINDKKAIL